MSESKTVEIGDTEVEITETEDGFEATEVGKDERVVREWLEECDAVVDYDIKPDSYSYDASLGLDFEATGHVTLKTDDVPFEFERFEPDYTYGGNAYARINFDVEE